MVTADAAGPVAGGRQPCPARPMPFRSGWPGSYRLRGSARWNLHWKCCRYALMVDMPVIVRHQDRAHCASIAGRIRHYAAGGQ